MRTIYRRALCPLLCICALGLFIATDFPPIFVGYVAGSFWFALPFIYMVTAPDWRKTRTGRALMMLLGSLALLFALIVSSSLFGEYPGRDLVRFIVYSAVLVAAVRLAVLFFQLRLGADWANKRGQR